MMVGLGGNNGTTLTATILANRHNISWHTKSGVQSPNYLGSLLRASTVRLGLDANNKDIYAPLADLLPMVHPNDLVLGGWDISGVRMDDAMKRAKVNGDAPVVDPSALTSNAPAMKLPNRPKKTAKIVVARVQDDGLYGKISSYHWRTLVPKKRGGGSG